MSLIGWVGFVERYVLEEDIYLQILNQRGKKVTRANKRGLYTGRYRGAEGAPFGVGDLEMHLLSPSENPADSDKGTKYKI